MAALGVLAAAGARAGTEPGYYFDQTLVFDGVERLYDLQVPAGYDGTAPLPLVVDLHGYGSNKSQQSLISGMAALGDAEGFAVVWPDGLTSSWNAASAAGSR